MRTFLLLGLGLVAFTSVESAPRYRYYPVYPNENRFVLEGQRLLVGFQQIWRPTGGRTYSGTLRNLTPEGYAVGVLNGLPGYVLPDGSEVTLPKVAPTGQSLREVLYRTSNGTIYGAFDGGLFRLSAAGAYTFFPLNPGAGWGRTWATNDGRLVSISGNRTYLWSESTGLRTRLWGQTVTGTTDLTVTVAGPESGQLLTYNWDETFTQSASSLGSSAFRTFKNGTGGTLSASYYADRSSTDSSSTATITVPRGPGGGLLTDRFHDVQNSAPGFGLSSVLAFDNGNNVLAYGISSRDFNPTVYYLQAVPEPATLLALAAGFIGFSRRRKRKGTLCLTGMVAVGLGLSASSWASSDYRLDPPLAEVTDFEFDDYGVSIGGSMAESGHIVISESWSNYISYTQYGAHSRFLPGSNVRLGIASYGDSQVWDVSPAGMLAGAMSPGGGWAGTLWNAEGSPFLVSNFVPWPYTLDRVEQVSGNGWMLCREPYLMQRFFISPNGVATPLPKTSPFSYPNTPILAGFGDLYVSELDSVTATWRTYRRNYLGQVTEMKVPGRVLAVHENGDMLLQEAVFMGVNGYENIFRIRRANGELFEAARLRTAPPLYPQKPMFSSQGTIVFDGFVNSVFRSAVLRPGKAPLLTPFDLDATDRTTPVSVSRLAGVDKAGMLLCLVFEPGEYSLTSSVRRAHPVGSRRIGGKPNPVQIRR